MSLRALLWLLALLAFIAAAVFSYSPRLARHTPALTAGGLALFTLGWLTHADLTD